MPTLRGWPGIVRSPRTIGFASTALALLAYAWIDRATPMYGDAAGYWSLGYTFSSETGYTDRLRGYSVPFLLHLVQTAAPVLGVDDVALFRILMALAGAALFGVALPALLTWWFDAKETATATLLFCLAGVAFWRGHFLYSLSDFPALLLLTVGLLWLPRDPTRPWRFVTAATSGACLGLAANARPIFAIALAAALAFVIWHWWNKTAAHDSLPDTHRRALAPITAFILGIGVALWPQAAINSRTLQSSSPRLPNLYQQQLAWGVAIQKYETNIGAGFPISVMFMDPRGQELLGQDWAQDPRVSIARSRMSLRAYARLVAAHPFFFASAYSRHLFNGLDVAYATPYVTHLAPRSAVMSFVNYAVLMLALVHGVVLLWRGARPDSRRIAIGTIWVLPAILAIPTAVEPRFMLPLWVIAYGFLAFRLVARDGIRSLALPWPLAVSACGIVACFALASATYANIFGAPAGFNLWCVWC